MATIGNNSYLVGYSRRREKEKTKRWQFVDTRGYNICIFFFYRQYVSLVIADLRIPIKEIKGQIFLQKVLPFKKKRAKLLLINRVLCVLAMWLYSKYLLFFLSFSLKDTL